MKFLSITFLLASSAMMAQPVLRPSNPVGNAGSYDTKIAQGSIFVVLGTNLGGDTVVLNSALPIKTNLGNASIRLTPVSGGAAVDAFMIYTTKNQLAGLLPSSTPIGDYNLTVTYNGSTSAPGRVTVNAQGFGIVTADSSGSGQAQAQEFRSSTAFDLNRFTTGALGSFSVAPARPGQVIVLYGTGLGADAQSDSTGGTSGDKTASSNIKVVVGGQEIIPAYAGRASALPGTDQVNFTLPTNVAQGCFVPTSVKVGSTVSNTVTLAIAPDGQNGCSHPSLTEGQLRSISQGGTLTLGSILLNKATITITGVPVLGNLDTTSETVSANFAQYGTGNLAGFGGTQGTSGLGQCIVNKQLATQDQLITPTVLALFLDAGAQLTLNGPNASNVAILRAADKSYLKLLSTPGIGGGFGGPPPTPIIAAGTYTVTGPGGPDVGAFTATLAMPTPIDWTNRAVINTINRASGQTFTWSGGTGGGNNIVAIVGVSGVHSGGTAAAPVYDSATFACLANAADGTFTVPSSVLSQMPASSGSIIDGSGISFAGVEMITDPTKGSFNAPLVKGGTVDTALFSGLVGFLKTITFQ